MASSKPGRRELVYLEYMERENNVRHHTNNEDMSQYALMTAGDMTCVDVHRRIMESGTTGKMTDDPVMNSRYLFVATAALASRACIGAGMDDVRSYRISDMFINRMDRLTDFEEINDLSCDMMAFYCSEMLELAKKNVYSKPVAVCIDHIQYHLHEKLSIDDLAAVSGLNRSYLTELFKRETGSTINDYILDKRVSTAENMLKYSGYSSAEISAVLAFSSQSYFIRVFKERTGYTPKKYRDRFYEST